MPRIWTPGLAFVSSTDKASICATCVRIGAFASCGVVEPSADGAAITEKAPDNDAKSQIQNRAVRMEAANNILPAWRQLDRSFGFKFSLILCLNGGGNNNGLIGASITKTIAMNGHYDFHFDQDLLCVGPSRAFVATAWKEL